jgi:hypothetical protein
VKVENYPFRIIRLEKKSVNFSAVNRKSNLLESKREAVFEIRTKRFRIKNDTLLFEIKQATAKSNAYDNGKGNF